MSKPGTVDEFFAQFDDPARSFMLHLREIADQAAPETHTELKWGSPAWIHASGTILFIVDGFKRHANVVFTPSTREAFDEDLVNVQTGKGSVKLPYAETVDRTLLERMIAYRIREYEQDGVLWM